MADLVGLDLIINDLENGYLSNRALDEAKKLRTGLVNFFALLFAEKIINDESTEPLREAFDQLAPFDRKDLAKLVSDFIDKVH